VSVGCIKRIGRASLVPLLLTTLSLALRAENETHGPDETFIPLSDVIQEICTRAGLQLVYSSSLVKDLMVTRRSSRGSPLPFALYDALHGTGLTFEFVNSHTVTIVKSPQSEVQRSVEPVPAPYTPPPVPVKKSDITLNDVVVTGTHIRNVDPVGADLQRITLAEIKLSGKATVQQLIAELPQNFVGSAPEGTPLGASRHLDSLRNVSGASGAGLRGLTPSATLVLLDGRRVAPGAGGGRFKDISTIPLVALDRIEVLPDGASAIYGADAIGGVINLILRNDYEGFETLARAGAADGNQARELEVAQLAGWRWSSGRSVLSFEYRDRGHLLASDRELSRSSDLRARGGGNFDRLEGNPGNILVGDETYAIPRGQDGRQLTPEDFQAGTVNFYNKNTPLDLLPRQETLSASATLRQEWGDSTQLFADTVVSERSSRAVYPAPRLLLFVPSSNPFRVNPSEQEKTLPVFVAYDFIRDFGVTTLRSRTVVADVAAGATTRWTPDWSTTASLSYSDSKERSHMGPHVNPRAMASALADSDPRTAFNPFGDGSHTAPETLDAIRDESFVRYYTNVWSIDAMTQGELRFWRGAPASLVMGVNHRDQSLSSFVGLPEVPDFGLDRRRSVTAVYGELHVPLMQESSQLSLAARHERYSDFGSATTPRVGLSWTPREYFTLRSTWSKSFKAPDLADLNESENLTFTNSLPDPASASGESPVLLWYGASADLERETATTWTLGTDVTLPGSGPSFGLTYFNTDLRGRVDYFFMETPTDDLLTDPQYREIVTYNPSPEFRADVCRRSPTTPNPDACLNTPVAAIIDLRYRNTAQTHTSGIDFRAQYEIPAATGEWVVALTGSYLLNFSERELQGSPLTQLLDTPGNPLRFRAKAQLAWTRGDWGTSATMNYGGAYQDPDSRVRIDDWTTTDLQLRHDTHHTVVSFTVQNVFNEMPGFWNNPLGVGYDLTNGNLLGRYAAVEIRRRW
jgi:iron complex outermembrane recepter protein